jgi:hypothetical protein
MCCGGPIVSTKRKEVAVVAGDDAEADVEELAATPEEGSENGSRSMVLELVIDGQEVVVAPIYAETDPNGGRK